MSSSRRSSSRHRHAQPSQLDQLKGVWRGIKRVASGKWLGSLAGIDRVLSKQQKRISQVIVPKRVRQSAEAWGKRVKKAENSVKVTGKQLSKSVAESSVGKSASQLARRGKSLEQRAGRFLLKSIAEFFASIVPKPIQDRLKGIGKAFQRVASIFFVFVSRWAKTRTYWQLIGGIPAFAMALPLAYCMVRMPFYDNAAKAKHYQQALWAAPVDAHEVRHLYRRKLDQLGGVTERVQFIDIVGRYDAAAELKDQAAMEAAWREMRKLAPQPPLEGDTYLNQQGKEVRFQPGYPDAHVWFALRHLENKQLQRAYREIDAALERNPASFSARVLHIEILTQLNEQSPSLQEEWEKSWQFLRMKSQNMGDLSLARRKFRGGEIEEGQEILVPLTDRLLEQFQDGSLDLYEYELLANALVLLGDVRTSEQVLRKGIEVADHNSRIHRELEQHLYQQCRTIAQMLHRDGAYPAENLRLAELAWSLKPQADWPLVHIAALAKADTEVGQDARDAAQRILKSDKTTLPDNYLAIFGTAAAEKGNYERARESLVEAFKVNKDARSANNLAWVLLQQKQDLAEALRIANIAVEKCPEDEVLPYYLETRGQIHLAMGNHQAAIADLSQAVNGLPETQRPAVHRALADAYQALGQRETAAAHRQRATVGQASPSE